MRLFAAQSKIYNLKSIIYAIAFTLIFQSTIPSVFALTTTFDFSNSSDYTLEDSNKIQVSNGAVSLAGGEETVEDVFSTYLYEGNNSTQTINNGIDLENEGGMIWIKGREEAQWHTIVDTENSPNSFLTSNWTSGLGTNPSDKNITSINSDGFSLGPDHYAITNTNTKEYVSWTFRESPGFFDVVTYTGDNSSVHQIAHDLGVEPGMIVVKRTDDSGDWFVYHRSKGLEAGVLNQTYAWTTGGGGSSYWANTLPTDSDFTVGGFNNYNGATYVAYLFAHDPSDDGKIQAGSFTTDGSGKATVDLGWEPQYLLVKSTNNSGDWVVVDTMRGWSDTEDMSGANYLKPNSSAAESNLTGGYSFKPTSTGFTFYGAFGGPAASSQNIYMAIRAPQKEPVNSAEVFAVDKLNTFSPSYVSNFPVDMAIETYLSSLDGRAISSRQTGNVKMLTNATNAEWSDSYTVFDYMNGWSSKPVDNWISWMWKRAPGFFDVVAYEGDGVAGRTVEHNLWVEPEMIWVKRRESTDQWPVYVNSLGGTKHLLLNSNSNSQTSFEYWNNTDATDLVFTLNLYWGVNYPGETYITYLFSSLPDVSKVGSYTGNGTSQTIDAEFTQGSSYILIKRTDSSWDWYMWDSERGIVDGNDPHLSLNTTAAQVTSDDSIDPDNSGFIVNQNGATNINVNGGEYIYMAIANPNGKTQSLMATDKPYTVTTKDSIQIDTSNWGDVNAAVASETLNSSNAWYSVSFDGRTTYAAFDSAQAAWRSVARENAGTWEYNSAVSGSETWTACSTNAREECLSESLETNSVNRMTGTQINAISDANWEASGGFATDQTTLDLAVTLFASSGNPTVSSVEMDYEPVTNIAPNNPILSNFNDWNSYTDSTPTLNFDLSDADESEQEGEEIKYQIQIDNNADFSSPEVDFTELAFITSPRASEAYTASGLADGQWYWRVKTIDDEGLESDWSTATLGFKIDVALPESKILYPQDGASLKNVNYIFGRSNDSQGVDKTRISIRNLTTGKYYTGTGFTADAETWIDTNPTGANQTRTRWWIAAPTWADFQTYTIRSRAIDMAGNEEHTDAITFTYDTVNGSEGSLYVSNPGVDNNSDYTIFYPNSDPVSSGGYIEIDFDDTFAFSPWLEDSDVTLSDNGGNITASTDSFDRFNKTIRSTITGGNVNGGDIIELAVSNLKIHNPSATGSYALPIRIYNSSDVLIEAGTGTITLVENYQQVEINVNIAESLQLRVDSGSVLLEVDPDVQLGQNWSGTGGTVSENTEVEVKTNAQGGYNLLISLAGNTATGSAVLDGKVLSGSQITSTTGDRVSVENNFTFGLNTGTSASVTAFNNASTQVSGAGSSNATNSYIDNIFYYLNINYTTPADTYGGTVTYTAVGQF